MSDSSFVGTMLGTAIGIVFVFLLFSLFLSTVIEAIASILKLRGSALRVAIARLVDDPSHEAGNRGFWLRKAGTSAGNGELSFLKIYSHPLIGGSQATARPAYVPSANFASALLSVLGADPTKNLKEVTDLIAALPDGKPKTVLLTIAGEANGDFSKLKTGIEAWFDFAMDRLSGEYKRYTQLVTFFVALGLAIGFNVDSVGVAKQLYADPLVRNEFARVAGAYVEKSEAPAAADAQPALPVEQTAQLQSSLAAATAARDRLLDTAPFLVRPTAGGPFAAVQSDPTLALGWLITALAAVLGAPFWFDLLQKLVNLRGAGPKPKKANGSPQTAHPGR